MGTITEADWKPVEKPGVPSYRVFTKPIVKSPNDDREYRIIELENGLRATLVHDNNADKAAASLDVAVGHLYDPDDMPGLAHFCEHLLFMGTEKFPQENEYADFLAKHSGSSNAYTSTSNTNYYFNVATSALPGALERFASFFHCPLFSPSCTSRELNAVDSEHKKNHQADMWRIFQLNKHLSKPGHVWSKFGSGNRESLSKAARTLKDQGKLDEKVPSLDPTTTFTSSRIPSPASSHGSNSSESEGDGGIVGRETRRRLVEWWEREYCASRMRLAIVGKESLDDLAGFANTFFSPIPNRGQDALPMISDHPFGPNEKGTLVSVKTVMAFHALEISFPLDYQPPFWKYKPANFLSHFVGHEGPGSLYSYLKNNHWATSLSCGPQSLARGFAMFKVTIHMTPEGFAHYRDIILATYKYLTLLRSSTFEYFHHQEVVNLSNIRFRFTEKRRPDDYATWITEHMGWPIPAELLLAAPKLTYDWENHTEKQRGEAKIHEYLNQFTINNSRVVLMAKEEDHIRIQPNSRWEKEPWYGTGYSVERFDQRFISEANGPNDIPDLFLPGPNEFIPTNLEVEKKEGIEALKRPHLIRQTPLSSLWHKKDDKFWIPKAHVSVDIRSPLANSSARASVLSRLYSDVVTDSLTEFSYDADLAGLSYNFSSYNTGFNISLYGYNDKMLALVRHVLDKVKDVIVNPQRLEVMKEEARRSYMNFFLGQSYSLSDYYARYLMSERAWTVEEKLTELSSVTAEEIEKHIKNVLAQVNIRILVAGNVYKDEAVKIAELVEDGLRPTTLPPHNLNERALLLPQGENFTYSAHIPNPNQTNSSLTYFTYYGPIVDDKLRVTSYVLTQILSEPAFNVLRTREQLGYIVSCTAWTLPGSSERGLRIVIQSEKRPAYLEDRVEAFFDEMLDKLEGMTEDEFLVHKTSLEKKWLEADKNLSEEVSRYVAFITSGHLDFLRKERDLFVLKTVTKYNVLELFRSKVHQSSTTRSKLSVHMISQKAAPKTVSVAAAEAFENLVQQAFPEVDVKAWHTALDNPTPSIVDFGKYWFSVLNSEEGKKILTQLPGIVDRHPIEGGGDGIYPRPGVTYIQDMKDFKDGLVPSNDPGPMAEWNDLPVPRF